jgi:hypothetical protein
MNCKTLLLALVVSVFLAPSAFAQDDPDQINDRLVVIEIQLDALTEFLVNNSADLAKICHVPAGNHYSARVLLVPREGVRAHLKHDFDYLIPSDEAPNQGENCDPYFVHPPFE